MNKFNPGDKVSIDLSFDPGIASETAAEYLLTHPNEFTVLTYKTTVLGNLRVVLKELPGVAFQEKRFTLLSGASLNVTAEDLEGLLDD